MPNVLIIGEVNNDLLSRLTRENFSAAGHLSGENGRVEIVFLHQGSTEVFEKMPKVDRIWNVECDSIITEDRGVFDVSTDIIYKIANSVQADIVIFAKNDSASIIAPRVAYRLDAIFANDCQELSLTDNEQIKFTTLVFGGKGRASYETQKRNRFVATLTPGAFEVDNSNAKPSVVEYVTIDTFSDCTRYGAELIDYNLNRNITIRLEEADVIVSGGRGIGSPEGFKQLNDLATLLGGAVGASGAACDAGWIDSSHKIGLTGKTVAPKLYITFGISGASQHMIGCRASQNIVAINNDSEASVFEVATFGIVGDWSNVLPSMIKAIKEIKSDH